jgi:DNA-binding transcriptional regulator YiaG
MPTMIEGSAMSPEEFQQWLKAYGKEVPVLARTLGVASSLPYKWADGSRPISRPHALALELLAETPRARVPKMDPAALRDYMDREHFTVPTLAAALGVSRNAVYRWLSGSRPIRPPVVLALRRVAQDTAARRTRKKAA